MRCTGTVWTSGQLGPKPGNYLFLFGLRLLILGPCRHNGIELRVLRETVNEGNRHVSKEQKALAGIGVGHIGKLVGAYP